jgi:hypothetical protein
MKGKRFPTIESNPGESSKFETKACSGRRSRFSFHMAKLQAQIFWSKSRNQPESGPIVFSAQVLRIRPKDLVTEK